MIEDKYVDMLQAILLSNKKELTLIIGGVKFTFLHYPFPVILPLNTKGPIPMLSVPEILAAKAYTIGRRGEFKDYIDIYCGLYDGHGPLESIIEMAKAKYGAAFNDRLFLEQLVYLDDVDETDILIKSESLPTKTQLVRYFSSAIKKMPAL